MRPMPFWPSFEPWKNETPEQVNVNNTLGVYLSPQQAKALWNILGQNLAQYEQTFGTLVLEPQPPKGPVH